MGANVASLFESTKSGGNLSGKPPEASPTIVKSMMFNLLVDFCGGMRRSIGKLSGGIAQSVNFFTTFARCCCYAMLA
jgi:hypothetical protein